MASGVFFTIHMAPWLSNPQARWNNGLIAGGMKHQTAMRRYPPQDSNVIYKRTMKLGQKADFKIVSFGKEMHFGSTYYAPYVILRKEFNKGFAPWRGKKDELLAAIKAGVIDGIKRYNG